MGEQFEMCENLSLYSAHFQLTKRCNLACRFCGQHKGMLASGQAKLSPAEWIRAAGELKRAAESSGRQPEIMLWGGEPLLYPEFDHLAETLHQQGFSLGIVTNATLLSQHADVVNACFDRIHVSVDGDRISHDAMRGVGVYDKMLAGLASIRHRRGKLVLLSTVSDLNVEHMAELPDSLIALEPDEVVLQPLMYLSPQEIEEYRRFSRDIFHCDYPELTAWRRDDDREYRKCLVEGLEKLAHLQFPIPVRFTPHCHHTGKSPAICQAALHRVHIRHDGEVGFCTDYFGFSAGNIRRSSLTDIFDGGRADLFRQAQAAGKLPICRHCPWNSQFF